MSWSEAHPHTFTHTQHCTHSHTCANSFSHFHTQSFFTQWRGRHLTLTHTRTHTPCTHFWFPITHQFVLLIANRSVRITFLLTIFLLSLLFFWMLRRRKRLILDLSFQQLWLLSRKKPENLDWTKCQEQEGENISMRCSRLLRILFKFVEVEHQV